MDNHSNESNKREHNASENNNNGKIAQSDLPLELLLEKDNDNDSKNENETSRDKEKVQNIVMLNKHKNKVKIRETFLAKITASIFYIFSLSFFGISIADIVIQIINPNGLNPYLIDDILLFVLPIIFGVCSTISSEIFLAVTSIAFLILMIGGYIVDNILFFKYFFEKNKSPKYIKYFYLSYIIIKFSDLGLGIIFIIILNMYF